LLPDPVRTILVQRVDQLGDLVCSVPAIRRLRELFPDAKLIGLTTAANAGLAESLGLFDDVVVAGFHEDTVERRRVMPIEEQERLRDALAPFRFDLAIDLGEGSESRPLLLLSGAKFLYGFKDRGWPWLSAGFELNMHDPVNRLEIMPPSRKITALVEALASMGAARAAPLPRSDAPRPAALFAYGIGPETTYAVLHTGARLRYSRWPHFAALVELLIMRTDLTIVVMADDERDFPLPETPSNRLHIVTGKIPFDDFDALLSYATIFVGNDSGPKHLAALRGTKVVSLHMARLNWSEWGQEFDGTIISRKVPCAGCAISDAPEECGKDFACLRLIQPDEVMKAIDRLLG
jgi:ADP-heptose:LPS heptosyltransferase